MKNKLDKISRGYALVEVLFYIALFAILSITIINSLSLMTNAFKEMTVQTDFVQSSTIMERISREIRQAYGINSISVSSLKLNAKDDADNNKTVRFLLSGSDIQLFEDDVLTGNLNSPSIQVVNLSFTEITSSAGKAIKIMLSVTSTKDTTGRIENFYETVVLRGDYGI